MTKLVIVESPAKAKTINRYLGDDYIVLASYGHVRDLPSKNGSVKPDENFSMVWEIDPRGKKQISDITAALKKADELILATDPDREGEAISWHIHAILQERKLLKNIPVKRVTFHEITKSAITHAMNNPREIDQPLVDAYLARRALDYLVGFTLSPVLWRKLPKSRSAGRVQSVALRLICERESEIEIFKPREYWDVTALCFQTKNATHRFNARLSRLNGEKLEQFSLENAQSAQRAAAAVENARLSIEKIEKKRIKRNPPPPFTTSTMQQEASRKLGMGAQNAMRTAQQLYEGVNIDGSPVGLITYMRTDGVNLAFEAAKDIARHLKENLGDAYVPEKPRLYQTKTKNAQEAHEAIRPTNIDLEPQKVRAWLTPEQFKLYDLIWRRAAASQMASAEIDQTVFIINDESKELELRASGSVVAFDGWLKILPPRSKNPSDDQNDKEDEALLPAASEGDAITAERVDANQHFTQPPPRYSEASLVKKMEEIGIGRPSTYASIIGVLKDRDYVRVEGRRFIPEDRGRLVTAFLTSFFERYVDTNFTADLEERLDVISAGGLPWREVMEDFWVQFSQAVDLTQDLKISDVIDALDEDLGNHFFPTAENDENPRLCPSCKQGRLGLKLGGHGAFIGCSSYPDCRYTRPLKIDNEIEGMEEGFRVLGEENGEEITLRKGPYGFYIQRGEQGEDKKVRPNRVSLPKNLDPSNLTLETAQAYLELPRNLGTHPKTGHAMAAAIGPYGPYVKTGTIFATLKAGIDVLQVTADEAREILDEKLKSIVTIGDHPKDGQPVLGRKGRFGPYLQHKKTMARLPKDAALEDITLEQAVELLDAAAQAAKEKKGKTAKTSAKTTAKSTTKTKTPAKKTPAKKTTKTAKTATKTAKKTTASKTKKTATKSTAKAVEETGESAET